MVRLFGLLATAVALTASPTTAGNRLAAQRDAARLLRLVVLPSGAQRLAKPPGHAGGLLGTASQIPSGKLVDRHRLWRVPDSLDSVVAFVKAHPPRGAQQEGSSSSGGPQYPQNETLTFSFPPRPGRISLRWLNVTFVALHGGGTGVRADAQDIWVVTRPRSEVVPAGVDEIDVGAARVRDATKVATIVRWFDALPIVQPDSVYHCQAVTGPLIRIAFRGAGGNVVARAEVAYDRGISGQCNPISFSIGGRRQTPLVGGDFLRRVQRLLGKKLA